MTKRILLTWLGKHDLDAESKGQYGPVASILLDSGWPFDEARILVNDWFDEIPRYEAWLHRALRKQKRNTSVSFRQVELFSPIDYPDIYDVCREELDGLSAANRKVTLNLTSGTPAMVGIWLLLGKGVFDTDLVQTSLQQGLSAVELPFDISIEYLQSQDGRLRAIASSAPELSAQFEHIQSNSAVMSDAVTLAKRLAPRNVPVIIQGESGTGKEVMAEAIHKASSRAEGQFVAVNCGAIPASLIDSQLFGHKKGAFTGSVEDRHGLFEEADGGTLFLDELGELPLDAQVKLLRVLQQSEITRVGESKARKVDVRIIAATHRDLLKMVDEGSFREDLFYRLAVGIVNLPALRERQEDIEPLIDVLLMQINQDAASQPGYISKRISNSAIKFTKSQSWPGNIRELWNTLLRASIWSDDDLLDVEHLQKAMISRESTAVFKPNNIDVSVGIQINEIIDETKRYLITEALKITSGQKVKATKLLGLPNHQTLGNWMKQLGIDEA